MENDGVINQIDSALLPFLNSGTEEETDGALSQLLLENIQPVIEKNLRLKMRASLKKEDFNLNNQEALEIASEVKLLIIAKLGQLKSNQNGNSIQNLSGYVASVTINAYQQYLRNKYPRRQQLKNKLRYLLTHHPEFTLDEVEKGWVCGFKQNSLIPNSLDLEKLQTELAEIVHQKKLRTESKTIDLVRAIFELVDATVYFNDLLRLVAEIQNIKDPHEINPPGDFQIPADFEAAPNNILSEIENREYLKEIWLEIRKLPVRHRLALLLNLTEKQETCLIHLFPLLRIASIRQIAEILEFPPEEFAAVWPQLPWNDLKIAEHLGLSRQQIINLRQSARAQLVRQLKKI